MTGADIDRELRRRDREIESLLVRRARLLAKIADLDARIMERGGEALRKARRRPRNEAFLSEVLVKLLTGKTMRVVEAADAVRTAGYRSTAASFNVIVGQRLADRKRFKRVSRGRYTAR